MDRDKISQDALASMAAQDEQRRREQLAQVHARRSWHLVQISSRHAPLAIDHLKSRGLEVYRPLLRSMEIPPAKELSRSQRKNRHLFAREKLVPIFGVYHFVRFDPEHDPWQKMFELVGVFGIAVHNNKPRPLPNALIDGLRAKEIGGAIPDDTRIADLPVFELGELVRVVNGPFRGFNGTIGSLDEAGRISVLLSLFGRATPVGLTIDDVEKI